jgi:hypothetical protein
MIAIQMAVAGMVGISQADVITLDSASDFTLDSASDFTLNSTKPFVTFTNPSNTMTASDFDLTVTTGNLIFATMVNIPAGFPFDTYLRSNQGKTASYIKSNVAPGVGPQGMITLDFSGWPNGTQFTAQFTYQGQNPMDAVDISDAATSTGPVAPASPVPEPNQSLPVVGIGIGFWIFGCTAKLRHRRGVPENAANQFGDSCDRT